MTIVNCYNTSVLSLTETIYCAKTLILFDLANSVINSEYVAISIAILYGENLIDLYKRLSAGNLEYSEKIPVSLFHFRIWESQLLRDNEWTKKPT